MNFMKKGLILLLAVLMLIEEVFMPENTVLAAEAYKTREEAAVWVVEEMEKRGEKVKEDLLQKIKEEKRISDLSKIDKKNQEAVLLAYHWGIIVGSSNGSYSKSRSFKGKRRLSEKEWKMIKERVENPKKRLKLSSDGQLCRTANLPSNHKNSLTS